MTTRQRSGRHFLQIPGPTNVPDRILRAMDRPTIDHRGPEFARLAAGILEDLKPVFRTSGPVVIYPSSGTGAWEAALVNTLSPGDPVLMAGDRPFRDAVVRDGPPARARGGAAARRLAPRRRSGADRGPPRRRSRARIKAVCVVHNETSTGVTSRVAEVRKAIDRAGHPALFMVDTISSLASIDYRQDEWGVDVTVGGSQKGLMLPPGLGFNALGDKALAAARNARLPKSYWDWQPMLSANAKGVFPYTPATNLLYGLREALSMLQEQGLEQVFARHARHAEATRRAVRAWGLELLCLDPREYSSSLTAVLVPESLDADALRAAILERYDLSLGNGLGKLAGRVFRIGHLGDFNDLMLAGTLCRHRDGAEGSRLPLAASGVAAALDHLAAAPRADQQRASAA